MGLKSMKIWDGLFKFFGAKWWKMKRIWEMVIAKMLAVVWEVEYNNWLGLHLFAHLLLHSYNWVKNIKQKKVREIDYFGWAGHYITATAQWVFWKNESQPNSPNCL